MDGFSQQTDDRPKSRWSGKRIVTAVSLLAAGGMAWLVWGTTPVLPDGPMVARRGENGTFTTEGSVSGSGFSGRLNALKVNQSRMTMSSHSSSDNTALLARSIAIFNLSNELLSQRIGYELFQRLQRSDRFQEVRYFPHDESLPDGELLPDLFATIDVTDLKEGGIVPSQTLDAKVRVTLGDQYRRSSHSYQGTFTPPALHFRWDSTVECQVTNLGVETGSARYSGVGEQLAESIAKEIGEYLDKQTADFGELIDPPPEFLPAYTPAPDWEFLKSLGAKRLLTGRNLMQSNVTVWRIDPAGPVGETIKAVADGLVEAGWPANGELKDVETKTQFRQTNRQDSESVECFEQSDGRSANSDVPRLFLVHTKAMSGKEIEAGMRALIARDASEEVLVPFSTVWHLMRDDVGRYFEKHPPRLLPSVMHLARQAVKANDPETAKSLVLRAAALRQVLKNEGPGDELKKLAQEVGIPALPKLPDVDALVSGGVVDLRQPVSKEIYFAGKAPVVFLLSADEKSQRYLIVQRASSRPEGESVSFRSENLELQLHGHSRGVTGLQIRRGEKRLLDMLTQLPAGSPQRAWINVTKVDPDSVTAEIVAE